MKTIITILCDNSISRAGIVGEHGFSLLIQRGDEKYLFDTGPGLSLPLNLKALNIQLDGLRKVFISHGHYDHTGALKWVVERMGSVEIVAHRDIFANHMLLDSEDVKKAPRYIGCPHTKQELEKAGATFRFYDQTEEVVPGIWFLSGIDIDPGKRPTDSRLVLPRGKAFMPDPVRDDASILLETDIAPILVMGCAHSGILNILGHLKYKMGINRLHAILGGTHLMFYDPESLPAIIDKLEGFSIDLIGVSHCTGIKPTIELAKHFGGRFKVASAGSVFVY